MSELPRHHEQKERFNLKQNINYSLRAFNLHFQKIMEVFIFENDEVLNLMRIKERTVTSFFNYSVEK